MEETEANVETTESEASDPIEVIKNLKATTVSKESYDKLQKDYNKILKAFAEGTYDPEAKKAEEPTKAELDKAYVENYKAIGSHSCHTNLEAAKRLLQLNDDSIRRGNGMIGLPTKGTPTQEDVEGVQRTWDLMRYAVEKAGDSETVYNAIIDDHLQDNNLIKVR